MIAMSLTKPNPSFFVDLITTDEDKKYAPAGRMAAAIIDITLETGDCLPQDLKTKGFAPDEVAAHWHMAQSLAAVKIKLMSGARAKPSLWRRKN